MADPRDMGRYDRNPFRDEDRGDDQERRRRAGYGRYGGDYGEGYRGTSGEGGGGRESFFGSEDRPGTYGQGYGGYGLTAWQRSRSYRGGDYGPGYTGGDYGTYRFYGGDYGRDEGGRREQLYGQHRGRGPKGYTRSDDRIREDVCDRLTDDPHIDASDVEIAVQGGEVTLSGTVEDRWAKRHAEDLAETISGVGHVQNNLRVRGQGTSVTGGTPMAVAGAMGSTIGAAGTDVAVETDEAGRRRQRR